MNEVGNNSQLVLDPDIDSYYTMDASVVQLRNLAQKLGVAGDMSAAINHRKQITSQERIDLAVLLSQVTTFGATLGDDIQQAGADDAQLKAKLATGMSAKGITTLRS